MSTRSRIAQQLLERKAKLGWGDRFSVRIGVPIEYNTAELQPGVRKAWLDTLQSLREHGHTIHILSLAATKMALSAYYILAPAEASSNLAKYDGVRYGNKESTSERADNVLFASTRGDGLGEEVRRRILLGSYSLSAAAIDLLRRQDEPGVGPKVDIILAPTAQSLPPKLSSLSDRAPIDSYSADVLTVPASLAGIPALSVPVPIPGQEGRDQKAPNSVGVQVIGQYGDEELVFSMAHSIELLGGITQ